MGLRDPVVCIVGAGPAASTMGGQYTGRAEAPQFVRNKNLFYFSERTG
jgi:hypothetical protein